MPSFEYVVKNKKGKHFKGVMTIEDQDKLVKNLRSAGLTVIEINEIDPAKSTKKDSAKKESIKIPFKISFGVSDEELAFFTRQFATILNAGLTIDRIFNILHNQTSNPKLKEAIHQVRISIQKGANITDALKQYKNIFDDMYISMIAIGEKSGTLPDAVNKLAGLIEKNVALRKKVQTAMAYPGFILIFSMVVAYVLLAVFLPGFIPIFDGIGINIKQDYPLTAALISLSNIATNPTALFAFVILFVLFIAVFSSYRKTKDGKYIIDKIILQIPGIREVVRQASVARFCRSYANLASSGVPFLESLHLVGNAAGNMVVQKSIERMSEAIKEGKSISKVMSEDELFPDLLVQMITVGEESGSVPEMFSKTADYYEENLNTSIESFTSLLEPIMMVVVGLVVGVFVAGVLLPILGITSKIGI
jgi:type IV pilus assembly protein PilC